MPLNFNRFRPKSERKQRPTKKQGKLYRAWRAYLKDSRLNVDEQHRRAAAFASRNEKVPIS